MKWATLVTVFIVLPVLALASCIYMQDRAARKMYPQVKALEAAAFAQQEAACQPATLARARGKCNQELKEASLRYAADKGKPPQSFRDLIDAGYLPRAHYVDPPMPPALGHQLSTTAP